jgi:hypothetical protein
MMQNLGPETETACAAIQLQTNEVYHSVACLQQGIDTVGGYFECLRLRKDSSVLISAPFTYWYLDE